ncbi:hypothetical protein IWX92DRAFT_353382 [Phyllosticta citricarpa]
MRRVEIPLFLLSPGVVSFQTGSGDIFCLFFFFFVCLRFPFLSLFALQERRGCAEYKKDRILGQEGARQPAVFLICGCFVAVVTSRFPRPSFFFFFFFFLRFS